MRYGKNPRSTCAFQHGETLRVTVGATAPAQNTRHERGPCAGPSGDLESCADEARKPLVISSSLRETSEERDAQRSSRSLTAVIRRSLAARRIRALALGLQRVLLIDFLELHPAFRTRTRSVAADLGMHGTAKLGHGDLRRPSHPRLEPQCGTTRVTLSSRIDPARWRLDRTVSSRQSPINREPANAMRAPSESRDQRIGSTVNPSS